MSIHDTPDSHVAGIAATDGVETQLQPPYSGYINLIPQAVSVHKLVGLRSGIVS